MYEYIILPWEACKIVAKGHRTGVLPQRLLSQGDLVDCDSDNFMSLSNVHTIYPSYVVDQMYHSFDPDPQFDYISYKFLCNVLFTV
jgi:hypothetical protein